MNTQPIEKQKLDPAGGLEVHSVFYTIQGEGPFVGQPAVFVRLAGCNLQCPLCDTDYTSVRRVLYPDQIIEQIDMALAKVIRIYRHRGFLVVITGGEPFRQNLEPFVRELLAEDYRVQIETNGTLSPNPTFPYDKVTIVCSPKTGKIAERLRPHLAALKYVMNRESVSPDGLPGHALAHPASPVVARPPSEFKGPIYLQAADVGDETANAANLAAVMDSCMENGYTLGVQLHKVIGKD